MSEFVIDIKVKLGNSIQQLQQLNAAASQAATSTGAISGKGGSGHATGSVLQTAIANAAKGTKSTLASGAGSVSSLLSASSASGLISSGAGALSGSIASAASGLSSLGPIGMGVAAALAAIAIEVTVFATAIAKGTEEFLALASGVSGIYFKGGGSLADSNRLVGVGAATGLSPAQIGGMARAFNEAIISNPYLSGQMAARGVVGNYNGPFGDINDTKRLLKGIEAVLNPNISDQSAKRLAYGNPLENFIQYRAASQGVQNMILDFQRTQMDPQKLKEATDAQAIFNISFTQLKDLLVDFGQMVLPLVVRGTVAFVGLTAHLADMYIRVMSLGRQGLLSPEEWKKLNVDMKNLNDLARKLGDASHDASGKVRKLGEAADMAASDLRGFTNSRQTFGGGPNATNALPRLYGVPDAKGSYGAQYGGIKMGQIPVG